MSKYPYNPLKELMVRRYKEGKKLAKNSDLSRAVAALGEALKAYESIKHNQSSQRTQEQQFENQLADKIRNKLVLVLNEYASQVIEKSGASLKNYEAGIDNLKRAIEYLNAVNKQTTDLTYLIVTEANLIRKLAFYKFRYGELLSNERNYTKSIHSFNDAITSLLSLTSLTENDRLRLNNTYRLLSVALHQRADSKKDLQSSIEDYREAIETLKKIHPTERTKQDRKNLATMNEKKEELLGQIRARKERDESTGVSQTFITNRPSNQLASPSARRLTGLPQPVFRELSSHPKPHFDNHKTGSLSPFITFQKKENKTEEEKEEKEIKKTKNKGPESGPA